VLETTCWQYDVPLLAAKGYPSSSSVRDLVIHQIEPHLQKNENQQIVFLHLGDHDPSGIDMSRDLERRLDMFLNGEDRYGHLDFQRIALNMDQIEEVNPPPNPAKVTDSRFQEYQRLHGDKSWELDALPPDYLNRLLREHIESCMNAEQWRHDKADIEDTRRRLIANAKEF
jgi:hypothetical protein